jgi:hypothetical protein
MRIVRNMVLVMLALLYLGGACAQASGVILPVVGTGEKAYSDFKGKTKEPFRVAVAPRRYMPLVKPVVVSPLVPVDLPAFGRTEKFQIIWEPNARSPLHSPPIHTCGTRAPPAL